MECDEIRKLVVGRVISEYHEQLNENGQVEAVYLNFEGGDGFAASGKYVNGGVSRAVDFFTERHSEPTANRLKIIESSKIN